MDLDLKPVLTPVRDLGDFIREQRLAAQISLRGLAARAGVSNPYLSQVERGLRRPSAEILTQIAHGLSISVETLLAKAGILDVPQAPEVIAAIRADPVLTERHKSVLVEVYAALRGQALAAAQPLASAGDGPGAEPDVDRTGPEPDVDRTDAAPEPAHPAATGRVPDVAVAVGADSHDPPPADRDRGAAALAGFRAAGRNEPPAGGVRGVHRTPGEEQAACPAGGTSRHAGQAAHSRQTIWLPLVSASWLR